jgi:hypothetical protein
MDVQLVLLRALAGMGARTQETPLKAGMVLPARVLGGGAILLAGVKLAAQLPPGLEPGSVVRLKVEEASNERLMLKVVETVAQPAESSASAPAAAAQPVPTFAVPLPNGAAARLLVDPEDASGEASGGASGERSFVTLRYESAGLGRVDLALSLEPGVVRAVAHAPAGEVAERLRAGSGELRAMLSNALGRPASVDIVAHAETFDAAA